MTSMRGKSLKFTSMSLILTKWHKNLKGIGETLLAEKRISIRPLSVLWFFYVCCFHLSHLGHCEIRLNRRETCQFKCFIASFNLFKVLQGSFQNEYWHMLTFPTGKYRLILYYPGRTFHFPRATGKRNSRPLLLSWIHKRESFSCSVDYCTEHITNLIQYQEYIKWKPYNVINKVKSQQCDWVILWLQCCKN